MKKEKNNLMFLGKPLSVRRVVIWLVGLYVMTFGIAFAVNSDFGVSAVTTLPYVCSRILNISVGTGTMIAYVLFILIELLVYRKEFKLVYVLQLPAAILFGWFTDINKALISPLGTPRTILMKSVFVLVGIFFLGIGLCVSITADIMAIPPDALAVAFGWLFKKPLGTVKRIFDLSITILSLTLSLIFLHDYQGIWIGTIMSAIGVGTWLNILKKVIQKPLYNCIFGKCAEIPEAEPAC